MTGLYFPFLFVPSLAATAAGWLLTDWRLAAAAAAGALGVLFLSLGGSGVFLLPVASGIAVGALTLVVLLLLRPDATLWSRMTWALCAAFAVHFAQLFWIGAA